MECVIVIEKKSEFQSDMGLTVNKQLCLAVASAGCVNCLNAVPADVLAVGVWND